MLCNSSLLLLVEFWAGCNLERQCLEGDLCRFDDVLGCQRLQRAAGYAMKIQLTLQYLVMLQKMVKCLVLTRGSGKGFGI